MLATTILPTGPRQLFYTKQSTKDERFEDRYNINMALANSAVLLFRMTTRLKASLFGGGTFTRWKYPAKLSK